MKFTLSQILILITALSIFFGLYAYETQHVVNVDRSYELAVDIKQHPLKNAIVSYALVNQNNLKACLDECNALDKLQSNPRLYSEPPTVVPFVEVVNRSPKIVIPCSEQLSPLFRRKLGSSLPYDCVVFRVKAENYTYPFYVMKYEFNWRQNLRVTFATYYN